MQSTYSSLLMLNQATQVITSDGSLSHVSPVECNLHHSSTDLDVDGFYCDEDFNIAEDFVDDHEDYELLLTDAPKAIQWKTKMSEIKVGCNSSTGENHSQLENERSHIEQKLLAACEKESMLSISHEDFLDLKFCNESEIMQTFIKSETPSLNNKCDALMKFLGHFVSLLILVPQLKFI